MTTDVPPAGSRFGALDRLHPRRTVSPRTLATRAIALVLWLLVASSAVAGFLAFARVDAAAPSGDTRPGGLEGFAELYVATWLEGGPVEPFHPADSSAGRAGPGERFVARAAAVRVRHAGDEVWAVTVGAEVLVATDGGYRRDGTRWFDVELSARDGGFVAAGVPAEVSAPAAPGPER
jgi:hypothetical protein